MQESIGKQEDELEDFSRITVDANRMGGVPCIRNMRIPVATVVGMVADGMTDDEILENYPDLEPEDIRAALLLTQRARREGTDVGELVTRLTSPAASVQTPATATAFRQLIERSEDLDISDLSEQHDHYLYGSDKR